MTTQNLPPIAVLVELYPEMIALDPTGIDVVNEKYIFTTGEGVRIDIRECTPAEQEAWYIEAGEAGDWEGCETIRSIRPDLAQNR